jgi:hypothetical protein
MTAQLPIQPNQPMQPATEAEREKIAASNRSAIYGELCASYRSIDDFRTKLLGFLPLATGAGIFLLLGDAGKLGSEGQKFLTPVGAFGVLITAGLYAFELYGIKKCTRLIKIGTELENKLSVAGQFNTRPDGACLVLNEPFASGVIYPAVLAAWTFLALVFACGFERAWQAAALIFFLGFLLPVPYWWPRRWWPRRTKK